YIAMCYYALALLTFFSIRLPRHPTSTLFPYTTLFRSGQMISQGKLKAVVDKVFPLKEAAKAHELLLSKEHVGKSNSCAFAASFKDRKSTRLNSSHVKISYAVFCLKKKKKQTNKMNKR